MCDDDMHCVVPFLSESPEYVNGVEMGLLFRRMDDQQCIIEGVYHRANDEQFFLMAQRMGYAVEWKSVDETWFTATFTLTVPQEEGEHS